MAAKPAHAHTHKPGGKLSAWWHKQDSKHKLIYGSVAAAVVIGLFLLLHKKPAGGGSATTSGVIEHWTQKDPATILHTKLPGSVHNTAYWNGFLHRSLGRQAWLNKRLAEAQRTHNAGWYTRLLEQFRLNKININTARKHGAK